MVRAIASSPSRGNPLGTLHNVRRRGCSTTGLPRADDVRSRLRAHVRVAGIGGPALRRRHRPPSGYRALHPRALRLPAVGRRVPAHPEPRAEERVQPRHGCVRSPSRTHPSRARRTDPASRALPSRRARPIPGTRSNASRPPPTLSPPEPLGARSTRPSTVTTLEPRSRVRHPPTPSQASRSARSRSAAARGRAFPSAPSPTSRWRSTASGAATSSLRFRRIPHSLPRHLRLRRGVESRQHRHHRPSDGAHPEGDGVRAQLPRRRASRVRVERFPAPSRGARPSERVGLRGLAHVPVHARRRPRDRISRLRRLAQQTRRVGR